jgi:hypothetical protein
MLIITKYLHYHSENLLRLGFQNKYFFIKCLCEPKSLKEGKKKREREREKERT